MTAAAETTRPVKRYDVDPVTGCWLWTGAKTTGGYASVCIGRKVQYAHRVFFERARGPIPEGLQLDHLCRVRHCVNPEHLEPVTHAENGRRGSRAKLDAGKAAAIRATQEPARVVAELFGVSPQTIWAVRSGRVWA